MTAEKIVNTLATHAQTAPRDELQQLAEVLEQTALNHPLEHHLLTLASLARITSCNATRALLAKKAQRLAAMAERILEAA